jgi:hypothetical protein
MRVGAGARGPQRWARLAGWRDAWWWVGASLATLGMAGCTRPAPEGDLASAIATYYAAHAVEEEGRCPSPRIESITKRKVLASSAKTTVLHVRYSYYDPSHEGANDLDQLFVRDKPCTGFAERDFTFAPTKLGHRIHAMSGPRQDQAPDQARAQPRDPS